ncbi:MAG: polyphosphate kinase 2 family protein [bacterium]
MAWREQLQVKPGSTFHPSDVDPDSTPGWKKAKKDQAQERLYKNVAALATLEHKLYAENRRAVLVVLQAMDAAGKDGLIRTVFSGLNPQGCRVTPFKVPSAEERSHDFLWRIHKALPPCGEIGVFNRSHYEDVLVVRVHDLVPKAVWKARYDTINSFERLLTGTGVTVVKFFLHIGRDEQKRRLLARLDDPDRNWKASEADFSERTRWDDYMKAYSDALTRCSTACAPWYVIPSNHKWYRSLAVSEILRETMEDMQLKFPPPQADLEALRRKLK